jgi:hypothetical protein
VLQRDYGVFHISVHCETEAMRRLALRMCPDKLLHQTLIKMHHECVPARFAQRSWRWPSKFAAPRSQAEWH